MKRVISFLLSVVMMVSIVSAVDLSAYAYNTSNSDNDFSKVSYTDVFYGYTCYLMNYNDVMREPITDSIIEAGEQFGIDDKFFASLETALDTVGSFSKTFYTITDAMGITSKLTDDAANKAITNVLKDIYEDEDSEFWSNIINKESESLNALKGSFDFIDNFNQAGFENYTLNELYNEVLQQSINKTCEFDVAVGNLNLTQKLTITNTVYEYYKDYIENWNHIVKLTKCINTILFYQNLEVELIDYILDFNSLDEDLIKGLKRIKSYINSNYATYFVETVTKEVIDTTLNKIGAFLGYGTPLTALASTACQFSSWLFFDVIYQHADAEDYLAYIYLLKFLYSAQYEMNNKLNFFNTDLVYSDTIDDFEYFYKIYSSVFKSSKKYAEKLLGQDINYIYQDYFFECQTFIDYIRNEVEKINVDERMEKATITDKTYKFDKSIILSNEEKESACLVTFHNRIFAPLVIDNNVEYDNCDLIVPELTINRSLTINNKIIVEGNYCSGSVANSTIKVGNGGILDVHGDSNICAVNHGYEVNTVSEFVIDSGGQFNTNNLLLKGNNEIGGGDNYVNLYNHGIININGDFNSNSLINIYNYNTIQVNNNVNFIAETHWVDVTNGNLYIYRNANFIVNNDMNLKGSNYYNTGNNWLHIYLYGNLKVDGNFNATNRFVSFDQLDEDSVWIVNGDFYADVLNENVIYGFDIGSCKGYICNLAAGKLILHGNYKKGGGVNISPRGNHTIILAGDQPQNIGGINASNILIDNIKGVNFNSSINVTTLFNHNGNQFTLYNDGKDSIFPDYDGDSYKDNVDPYPLVKHPDEHDYIFSKTVAATCVAKGYDAYICPYCNGVDKRNLIDMIPHSYGFSETVLPTCTARGYDLYVCSQCNGSEKRNYTNIIPHEYEFTKTVEPTCTAQGYDLYTCSVCNGTEKRNTVSAKGHSSTFTKTVEPTCTAQGYDLYTCSVCNATEKRNTVSSTGHNYEEKSNTATCTESGIKITECSKCGDTKTSEVSALGHAYNKVYTAPTCTESGGYTNTCTRCDDVVWNIYEAKGHDYGECIGESYIQQIYDADGRFRENIPSTADYYGETFYSTSAFGRSIFQRIKVSYPQQIRLADDQLHSIEDYVFYVSRFGLSISGKLNSIFAYNPNTGREPQESAIPYTDSSGNLVNMKFVDYKENDQWINGEYLIDKNQIVDVYGNSVSSIYSETRPHIVYYKNDALQNGIMNGDGTVNVESITDEISFSSGVDGIYTAIYNASAGGYVRAFGYDDAVEMKSGIYNVSLCFYSSDAYATGDLLLKIYDTDRLICKIPATASTDEKITYTCMDCGETHTDTCKLNISDFKIAASSISLANHIRMNYKVLKTAVTDFENPYIEVTRNGKTVKITEYAEQGDYYVFSYQNIAPQCMGDTLTAVLYGTHNGILYSSTSLDFSVKEYAYRMLQICEPEQYSSLRTLLVDMLNYGSEAQIYMNYNTDKLVNSDLAEQQKLWASNDDLSLTNIANPNYKEIENPSVIWKGVGLSLYDSVSVRYTFTADNIDDLTLKVICDNRIWTYGKDDITDNGNGTYSVLFNNLDAHQMSDEIYITAYRSDIEISNTLRYSVESYAASIHDSMPNSTLEDLTKAMIKYGASATKYAK